jgi:hypothetical protein
MYERRLRLKLCFGSQVESWPSLDVRAFNGRHFETRDFHGGVSRCTSASWLSHGVDTLVWAGGHRQTSSS